MTPPHIAPVPTAVPSNGSTATVSVWAAPATVKVLDLLGDPNNATRPEVGKLRAALLADDPLSVLNWLRRSPTIDGVLTELASGACTFSHEAIEERLPGKVGAHFRAILVAAQALPPRDEHLATVQHWVDTILTTVTNESDQRLIRTYVTWHHLAAIRAPQPREACDETMPLVLLTRSVTDYSKDGR